MAHFIHEHAHFCKNHSELKGENYFIIGLNQPEKSTDKFGYIFGLGHTIYQDISYCFIT